MNGTPQLVGSIHVQTPTQLAEKAIKELGKRRRYGLNKRLLSYEVGLDLAGRVFVDLMGMTPPNELLMACNYRCDPDDLADAIRFEKESRNLTPLKRRYGPRKHKEAA